ncbi:MAG: protein phosphatase CheZ [Desulfovibrionaceae bacterium]|nr:protein phosphatase CheZ [Desulfovibrionaceae bacterium]
MAKDDDLFRQVMQDVTETLTANLREVLSSTLEKQLTESLTKSLLESEFYRRISTDMRSGLRRIYKEMGEARNAAAPEADGADAAAEKAAADKLFHDASEQLSAVLRQTEDAANTIMGVVEKQMDWQAESAELLEKARKGRITPTEWQRLNEINQGLGEDLVTLMTAMSFQDLTGQRIKKVSAAIKQLESTVLELYLSSGLMMKAYEEEPGQDLASLEEQTKAAVLDLKQKVEGSELKGPTDDANQNDIDALLAQFGL